ncbi:MAG: UDP-N-acetylmuramoyl-L-alanyl-D-glutamate--2,6-diaminopimelate ligase, partial [Asticcacaulis sp.]|nr:UDP-N-acetylmuramoyl-L-alanyl-D-glutamate--2,6-diaminopimelate ligase [Asticcacaulis sp.]
MIEKRLSELVMRPLAVDPLVSGVTADSRQVRPGSLFAALPGSKADGRAYVEQALQAGAAAILAAEEMPLAGAPVVCSADVRRAYALAARAFWGAQPEVVVTVTGTNGKTSVATFCRQIFTRLGRKAARLAALLAEKGVTHLALEASSHGLDQRRLDGLEIQAAGFTQLSQDHLDYHHGMDDYRRAKLRLFEQLLPRGGSAVLNADAHDFPAFAGSAVLNGQRIISVGESGTGLRLVERTPTPAGQRLKIAHEGREYDVALPLAGAFQASNVMIAAGLCIAVGEAPEAVLAALETLEGAPGRMQRVGAGRHGGEAYVDYAHTPDGLRTVLEALRPHTRGRLMAVIGAGGDRDKGKRPLMGEAAAILADLVIVTDDNPRGEDPAEIRGQ